MLDCIFVPTDWGKVDRNKSVGCGEFQECNAQFSRICKLDYAILIGQDRFDLALLKQRNQNPFLIWRVFSFLSFYVFRKLNWDPMGKEFVLYPVGILEQSRLILSNEQIRDSVRQRAKLLRHSIYVIREIDSHQQDWHLLVVEKQQKENVRVFSDRKWSCSCEEGPECVHVMAVAMAIQEGPLRDIAELNEKSIHKLDVATDCSMTWDSTGQTFLAIYEIHPKKTLLFFIERSLLWGGAIHVYRRWYSSIEYRKEMMSRIRKDGWSNVIDLLRSRR